MFQQVFERVQVLTVDRLMHVLAGSGNALWERRKPQVALTSNDAHINAGCVRSRDDTDKTGRCDRRPILAL